MLPAIHGVNLKNLKPRCLIFLKNWKLYAQTQGDVNASQVLPRCERVA